MSAAVGRMLRVVAGVLILVVAVGPAAYPEVSVHLVKDITPGLNGSSVKIIGSANGQVLFSTSSGIWKSNGAAAGTVLLAEFAINPTVVTPRATLVGNSIFFMDIGFSESVLGLALYRTDVVNGGKVQVAMVGDEYACYSGTNDDWMMAVNGILLFNVEAMLYGNQLWRSDGTEAGTFLLRNQFNPASSDNGRPVVVGDTLYFGGYGELWKTDGTAPGTIVVKQFSSSLVRPQAMAGANGLLFFYALAPTAGTAALWRSDGTEAGTIPIKEGMTSQFLSSDDYRTPAVVNGTVYFSSTDGVNPWELWKTDGTLANTARITGFGYSANDLILAGLTAAGDYAYFVAFRWTPFQVQLWRSNGIDTGTIMLRDFTLPSSSGHLGISRAANGALYFEAEDADHGIEPWKSEGTASSTGLLADICPGSDSSRSSGFTGVDDTVFFVADDGVHGYELWAYGPERSGPTAGFSAEPLSGDAPLEVEFADDSTPGTGVTHWQWNFGDGATSTEQNPSHTYAEAGAYTVSLTLTGTYATDVKTRSWYVDVGHSLPVADDTMAVAAMLAAVALAGAFAMRRTCFP